MNNPTFKERAHAEILNFSYVALYLFICFAVLMFFESTLTDRANTGVFPRGRRHQGWDPRQVHSDR